MISTKKYMNPGEHVYITFSNMNKLLLCLKKPI